MKFSKQQAYVLNLNDETDDIQDASMPMHAHIANTLTMLAPWPGRFNQHERPLTDNNTFRELTAQGYKRKISELNDTIDELNSNRTKARAAFSTLHDAAKALGDEIVKIQADQRYSRQGSLEMSSKRIAEFVDLRIKAHSREIGALTDASKRLKRLIDLFPLPEPTAHEIAIDQEIRSMYRADENAIKKALFKGISTIEALAIVRAPASLSGLNDAQYGKVKADYTFMSFFAECYAIDIYNQMSESLWTEAARVLLSLLDKSGFNPVERDNIFRNTGYSWQESNLLSVLAEERVFIDMIEEKSVMASPIRAREAA
ncbi:hypothetical protein [Methylotuvimicrobium buryatense]|uniref:Uncharacterized protein n=1 Tax=Methylotuvimicrobium buryatense TaxID=95641 RepID=A0A4P9UX38_METBY|nr:hypothetical protein [Methylotuvimicrobium buryatense]QCW84376.1 hypothetical protein EQU24_20675 [Methylotuvimicrobium buryatense]